MNLEKTLADELHAVGSAVRTPPPPGAAELARTAERVRAGKRVRIAGSVVLAAAAIAAAVAIGNQIGQPDAAPLPLPQPTELPTGKPPQIPYVGGSTLYLGDQILKQGSWEGVTTRGRTSIADLAAGGETPARLVVFNDNTEVFRIEAPDYQGGTAVLSPDGSKLAWLSWKPSDNTFFLVEREVATNREVGRLQVDAELLGHVGEETEGWEHINRIANDGTVTYGSVVVQHSWKPGSAPVDHSTDYVGPDLAGYPPDAENVMVNSDNTWAAWSTDHNGNGYPGDGSDYVPDGITLQRPQNPGSRSTIKLPTGTNLGGLSWETPAILLAVVYDDPDATTWHFVRCDIDTRRCELAPTQTGP